MRWLQLVIWLKKLEQKFRRNVQCVSNLDFYNFESLTKYSFWKYLNNLNYIFNNLEWNSENFELKHLVKYCTLHISTRRICRIKVGIALQLLNNLKTFILSEFRSTFLWQTPKKKEDDVLFPMFDGLLPKLKHKIWRLFKRFWHVNLGQNEAH